MQDSFIAWDLDGRGPAALLLAATCWVVAQVALSLVLLISAGLFLRSLQQRSVSDPGFDPESVLTMPLNINLLRYTKLVRGRNSTGECWSRWRCCLACSRPR